MTLSPPTGMVNKVSYNAPYSSWISGVKMDVGAGVVVNASVGGAVAVSVASGVGCAGCVGVIVTSFSGNGVADLLIGAVGDALTCAHAVRSANEKHSKYRILIIR